MNDIRVSSWKKANGNVNPKVGPNYLVDLFNGTSKVSTPNSDGGPSDFRVKVPNMPLEYCPNTGVFLWLQDVGKKKAGSTAGSLNKQLGYVQIRYNKVLYYAHRLAVLTMTGVWPEEHVDHIDTNRSNNAWNNLRVATQQQNLSYRPKPVNNKSGQKGVYWATRDKRWIAKFSRHTIGNYTDFDTACKAYKKFTQKLLGDFYYEE